MKTYDADMFVVGGGPAGLAAAIAARQHGLRVIVADASDAPADKCCGEGLMPDGLAALRQLGVAIPSDVARFWGITFHDRDVVAPGLLSSGSGAGIRRTRLHRLLLDRALDVGVDCRFKTRVTGIGSDTVLLDDMSVRTRWIVGADGFNSRVRDWAGLNAGRKQSSARRYASRRHFQMDQVPHSVEIYWHDDFQLFVTPINAHEVGVAILSQIQRLRLKDALDLLPQVHKRLGPPTTKERGAITGNTTLRSVHQGNVVLVGDASGTVDSITGEGLCLAFRQAIQLSAAIANNDLSTYARMHRKLAWQPRAMAHLLLGLANYPILRHAAIRLLAANPLAFQTLLSAHSAPSHNPEEGNETDLDSHDAGSAGAGCTTAIRPGSDQSAVYVGLDSAHDSRYLCSEARHHPL